MISKRQSYVISIRRSRAISKRQSHVISMWQSCMLSEGHGLLPYDLQKWSGLLSSYLPEVESVVGVQFAGGWPL